MPFLNCGQATPEEGAVRIAIWDGTIEYAFRMSVPDISAPLQERQESVPVSRLFGLYETKGYGNARLSYPDASGQRKGVVLWVPCLPGRRFTITRKAVAGVARTAANAAGDRWLDAVVSELIRDPAYVGVWR